MQSFIKFILPLLFLFLSACDKDKNKVVEPEDPNDNEIITTVKLVFQDLTRPSSISNFTFKDPDGDGQRQPTQLDTIRLLRGITYKTVLLLLNEAATPTDTISKEVFAEGHEHQVIYTATNANVTFAYLDKDKNGVPIGLSLNVAANAATATKSSTFKVVLKHQGTDKPKAGNGNQALGSTDVEVNFPLIVQ